MNNDAIAFMPGLGADDQITRYWLRQATLRLRREVCWLWRERSLQGLAVAAASTSAPVPVPAAQAFAAPRGKGTQPKVKHTQSSAPRTAATRNVTQSKQAETQR